jgi:hypothetical protein
MSKENRETIMSISAVGIAIVAASAIIYIVESKPEPDRCTPELIASYTETIIAHKDCEAMSNCIIKPSDIRFYNKSQAQFDKCVIEVSEGKQ